MIVVPPTILRIQVWPFYITSSASKIQIEFQILTSETNKRKRQEEAASTGRKAKTRRGRGGKVIKCGLIHVCFYNIRSLTASAWSTSSFGHVKNLKCLECLLGSLLQCF